MSVARRLFEPRGWTDRALYALQMVFLPYTAAVVTKEGFPVSGVIMIALWVPFSFYTIEWVAQWLLKKLAR